MANKLELTWYGKDEPIRVEPRLLIENTELSNTAADPETQNMLIHGDNLLALKALESKFAGQVKCIYIDPPYNTGSAFEHYDDNLEHSIWLNLMRPRLEILWNLLDGTVGSLWISIDDSEQAYMRVLCDELFGRHNFVAQNKKAATETGRALGRAYTSKITDEVERIWKEIIAEVDFLNRMLSAVRIRNGMDRSSFINHIIYSSGLKDAKESRAGAGALIEIFKSVGVLSEVDGKLSVLDEPSSARVSVASNTISTEQTHSEPVAQQALPVATISAKNSIVINININCTPADIDGLGEKISQLLYELSE